MEEDKKIDNLDNEDENPSKDAQNAPREKDEADAPEDMTIWEELRDDNSVVKKYIIYISKDFVPLMDDMSVDKRSAYINDAIQNKLDLENEKKQKNKKIKLVFHIILMIVVFFALMPWAILGANKAIMATFENYKYSQDNFEKLYKHHFEKTKIYNRTLQYSKERKAK